MPVARGLERPRRLPACLDPAPGAPWRRRGRSEGPLSALDESGVPTGAECGGPSSGPVGPLSAECGPPLSTSLPLQVTQYKSHSGADCLERTLSGRALAPQARCGTRCFGNAAQGAQGMKPYPLRTRGGRDHLDETNSKPTSIRYGSGGDTPLWERRSQHAAWLEVRFSCMPAAAGCLGRLCVLRAQPVTLRVKAALYPGVCAVSVLQMPRWTFFEIDFIQTVSQLPGQTGQNQDCHMHLLCCFSF